MGRDQLLGTDATGFGDDARDWEDDEIHGWDRRNAQLGSIRSISGPKSVPLIHITGTSSHLSTPVALPLAVAPQSAHEADGGGAAAAISAELAQQVVQKVLNLPPATLRRLTVLDSDAIDAALDDVPGGETANSSQPVERSTRNGRGQPLAGSTLHRAADGGTVGPAADEWDVERYLTVQDTAAAAPTNTAVLRQLARTAAARTELADEFGLLTAGQVHDFSSPDARDRAATADLWTTDGRIFAVPTGGGDRYPAFQFVDGVPAEPIRAILAAFGDKITGWSAALWFTAANGWIDSARPVDLLQDQPGQVIAAAQRAADQIR